MKAAAFSLVVLTLSVAGPRRVSSGWPTRRDALVARLKAEPSGAAAFQELWRGEDLDALAAAAGHANRAFDPSLGLAITSALPITESEPLDLGDGAGALRARIAAGKLGADLYSVRLESGDGPARARRLGQLFRLAEFVRARSAGRPFVVLGGLGASADEREIALTLDLLEARDLCVSHGDEVCGRTLGDQRVDYALIPYSSRAPKENARAAFTDAPPPDADEEPEAPRFGLRAPLDDRWLALKPAARPQGRDEALEEIAATIERARDAEIAASNAGGLIPFWDALVDARRAREIRRLSTVVEEIRTAQARSAPRELPAAD